MKISKKREKAEIAEKVVENENIRKWTKKDE